MPAIDFRFTGNSDDFVRACEQVTAKVKSVTREVEASGASLDSVFSMLKSKLGALGVGIGLQQLVSQIVSVRGEFQKTAVAIETMLGSKSKANALMKEVKDIAASSPLQFTDISKTTQMMLGFNIEAEKVPGFIRAIGDISMGEAGKFQSLSLAFSQMSATGKLMGQDLLQMINAGFNPLAVMAETTGKSVAKLKEEMSEGAISAEMVQEAFIAATSAGGKFYQMSEKTAETMTGQISMLQDAIDKMFDELGQQSEGVLMGAISVTRSLVENYQKVGEVLLSLVASYGAYKTAVMLAAAAEQYGTLAKAAAVKWTNLVTLAQKAYNAALLSNPYVAAAVALGALVTAMVAFYDRETEGEKAVKRFNERLEAQKQEIDNNTSKAREYVDVMRDETSANGERTEAYNNLISLFPTLQAKYKSEGDIVRNLTQFYKDLAAAARDANAARNLTALNDARQERKDLERIKELKDKGWSDFFSPTEGNLTKQEKAELASLLNRTGFNLSDDINSRLDAARKNEQTAADEVRKDQQTARLSAVGDKDKKGAQAQAKAIRAALKRSKENGATLIDLGDGSEPMTLEQARDYASALEAQAAATRMTAKQWQAKEKADKRKAQSDAKAALETDEQLTREQYEKRQQALDAANKAAKADEAADRKAAQNAHKAAEARKKREQERLRVEEMMRENRLKEARDAEDMGLDTRQYVINAMAEGGERERKQIELDRDKEMLAIRRAYEDLRVERIEQAKKLWDAKEANNGKDFFQSEEYRYAASDDRYTQQQKDNREAAEAAATAAYERSLRERTQADAQYMLDYLKQYGTFQQTRLAIAEEYARKIAYIQRGSDSDEVKRAKTLALQQERDRTLSSMDARRLAEGIDWGTAFDGIGHVLSDIARKALAEVDEYMKTDEYKKLDADNKKAYQDLRTRLKSEVGDNPADAFNFNLWGDIAKLTDEYKASVMELRAALDEEKHWSEELAKAKEDEAKATTFQEQQDAHQRVKQAESNLLLAGSVVKGAQQRKDEKENELTDATSKAVGGMNAFASCLNTMNNGSLKGFADGVARFVTGLRGEVKGLETLGKAGGIVGAILSILDAMGDAPAEYVEKMLDNVSTALYNVLSQLPQILVKIVGGVFSGGGIIGSIFSGIASWFTGSNAEWVAEVTDTLTKSNDRLGKHIDDLRDAIDEAAGGEAIRNYQEAYEAQQQVNRQTVEILRAQMGEWGKHHSNNAYGDESWRREFNSEAQAAFKRAGVAAASVSGMSSLYALTPEQIKALRDYAPKLWEYITSVGEYDKSEYWDNVVDQAGKLEDLTEAIRENLTQTSFDSLRSSFLDTLMDMDASAQAWGENFTEMMQRALLNAALGEMLDGQLKTWYEDLADEMEKNGGTLSPAQIQKYRQEWDGFLQDGIKKRDQIAEITGYQGSNGEADASRGAFKTMSEDTGNELNGRFTALQITGEAMRQDVARGIATLQALSLTVGANGGTLAEMRDIMVTQNAHLEDISRYTRTMAQWSDTLERIAANTGRL